VTLFRPKLLVLATGCHDAVPTFAGGDLPGILSARAGLALERAGIVPDRRIVLVGSGRLTQALATKLSAEVVHQIAEPDDVVRALGKLRLRGLAFRTPGGERQLRAGALLYEAAAPPAFELAVQAGGSVEFRPALGYAPRLATDGLAAKGVFCAGSVAAGRGESPEGVARAVRRALG
jgi:sarcosine oxidase subunit alpha